jgi:hypothetical protein
MSPYAFVPAAACAALLASACASAPAPVAYGRNETGVVVAARPIVVADADVVPTPAAVPLAPAADRRTISTAPLGPVQAPPGALTTATPPPEVRVVVIADAVGPGETQRGVSYTIRRDRDGSLFEVAQPVAPPLAAGTRVNLVYDGHIRIAPVG